MTLVACFEIKDEILEPDEITTAINEGLSERGVGIDAIISIMQPSGYAITRVFYKEPK